MKKNIPGKLSLYKKTKVFSNETVPEALKKNHKIIPGSWGRLVIQEGELILKFNNKNESFLITKTRPGIIEPEVMHFIELKGKVSFYIEFYK